MFSVNVLVADTFLTTIEKSDNKTCHVGDIISKEMKEPLGRVIMQFDPWSEIGISHLSNSNSPSENGPMKVQKRPAVKTQQPVSKALTVTQK